MLTLTVFVLIAICLSLHLVFICLGWLFQSINHMCPKDSLFKKKIQLYWGMTFIYHIIKRFLKITLRTKIQLRLTHYIWFCLVLLYSRPIPCLSFFLVKTSFLKRQASCLKEWIKSPGLWICLINSLWCHLSCFMPFSCKLEVRTKVLLRFRLNFFCHNSIVCVIAYAMYLIL